MSFNFARNLRESAQAHPDQPLLHLGDRSLMRRILTQSLTVRGFVQDEFVPTHNEGIPAGPVPAWITDGSVRYQEDIVAGLENAPEAFRGLPRGGFFGKVLVQVGADPRRDRDEEPSSNPARLWQQALQTRTPRLASLSSRDSLTRTQVGHRTARAVDWRRADGGRRARHNVSRQPDVTWTAPRVHLLS